MKRISEDEALRELLDRFRDGSEEAFEDLVSRTEPRLLRAARRIIKSDQDGEDCVQTAYYSLLRKERFPDGVPVQAWLMTAVVRIAYREVARRKRHVTLVDELTAAGGEFNPYWDAALSEQTDIIRSTVDTLPAEYRDPLVLHYLQGLKTPEIALLMGLPESTVRTRLRRGRDLLEPRLARSLRVAITSLLLVLLARVQGASGDRHHRRRAAHQRDHARHAGAPLRTV